MKRKAGRPKGEPTRVISFRVPERLVKVLNAEVKKLIQSLLS